MRPEPYDELIAPIERRMIRTVARLVRDPDDAADAVQEVLEYVWKNLGKIRRHPNPHAYIMKTCISKAYDTLRKRARRNAREVSLEEVLNADGVEPREMPGGGCTDEQRERVEGVLAAIARLPSQQAQAVMLRLVSDCSFPEIAETLGCAEATAYSHFSKGKARLRQIFSENHRKKEPRK